WGIPGRVRSLKAAALAAASRRLAARCEQLSEIGLGKDRYAELLCLLGLRARALADDDPGRLLRDGVGHLRAKGLERCLRLLPGPLLERAGDAVLRARQPPLGRSFVVGERELQPELPQLADECEVVGVREPLGNELCTLRADPLDLFELL